jgi:sec-independent protein translocase protein TatB
MPIGLPEIFLIFLVALVFIHPKELPGLFRRAGSAYRKAMEMRREFTRTLEELEREAGRPPDGGTDGGKEG